MDSGDPMHIIILSQKSPRATALQTMISDGLGENAVVSLLTLNDIIKADSGPQKNICIVDLMSSEDAARATLAKVREAMPMAGIIAMHIYNTAELVQPLIDQGADGYLSYDPSRHELIGCIRDVAAGKIYLPAYIR